MLTAKGPITAREVVIATNGYTGDLTPRLKHRVVPVASHIIATEQLPMPATDLIPLQRSIGDTKRVLTYYRPSPDGKHMIFGGRARFTAAPPEVSAPILYQYMIDRFPQLDGIRITHVWTGNVAFALDSMSHMGQDDGMHYLLACNGSGVAMMTYLGTQTAKKIAGGSNAPINAFDGREFPEHPLYNGDPSLYLPLIGAWYRTRDWIDRRRASLMVTLQDVRAAAERIAGAVVHTPCLRSETLSRIAKADIWLKFENLQFTASFKERGALNTLLQLTPDERQRGVIAMSAGNHAQGVAYHAGRLGIPATIVMPAFTPNMKVTHTRGHGAKVVLHGNTLAEAARRGASAGRPSRSWCSSIPTTIRASSQARAPSRSRCCRTCRNSTRWWRRSAAAA